MSGACSHGPGSWRGGAWSNSAGCRPSATQNDVWGLAPVLTSVSYVPIEQHHPVRNAVEGTKIHRLQPLPDEAGAESVFL
jgi:hypothetical protein